MPSPRRHRTKRTHRARAVVTGAGSGIGRAYAHELARRGSQVVCVDINPERANETVGQITARGGHAYPATCDVASRDQLTDLAAAARELLGGPTSVLVNNAGVGLGGRRIGEIGFEDWDWAIGINLWGAIAGCEIFMDQLRESGWGGVINTASAAGFAAAPSMGPYNVSKAGVIALSETLAAELSGTGLAVTVLCPTAVRTQILEDGRIADASARLAQTALRLTGFSPRYVARRALDALDRGQLYVVPQPDAKAIWALKRLAPGPYTMILGAGYRALSRRLGEPD